MRVLLCVCFTAVFIFTVDGQTDPEHVRLCGGVEDFDPCSGAWNCNATVSRCFCKAETPFCRCNNFKDEFYLGEDCSQRWNTLTFALVASLPGVTLALVVGVTVHLIHTCQNSSKSTSYRGGPKVPSGSPSDENMFPGIVFASDLSARSNGPPSGPSPPQGGVNMPATSLQPYSQSNNPRPDRPPMGDPRPPYSPAASMRPGAGRPQIGGRGPPNSTFDNVPPSPRAGPSFDKPVLGGPPQPYSYTAGPGQVLGNPYAKSRNPYDERSPSPDHYRTFNPPASSHAYEDIRMEQPAPPYSSGPEYSNRSAPDYSNRSAPEYSNRSAFPRAQVNRRY